MQTKTRIRHPEVAVLTNEDVTVCMEKKYPSYPYKLLSLEQKQLLFKLFNNYYFKASFLLPDYQISFGSIFHLLFSISQFTNLFGYVYSSKWVELVKDHSCQNKIQHVWD